MSKTIHAKKTIANERLVKITFEAPASLQKAVKLKATEDERSIKEVLCWCMDAYVKEKIKIEEGKS
jgi:hypothetical protein